VPIVRGSRDDIVAGSDEEAALFKTASNRRKRRVRGIPDAKALTRQTFFAYSAASSDKLGSPIRAI
jgi:hypothetical protein